MGKVNGKEDNHVIFKLSRFGEVYVGKAATRKTSHALQLRYYKDLICQLDIYDLSPVENKKNISLFHSIHIAVSQ